MASDVDIHRTVAFNHGEIIKLQNHFKVSKPFLDLSIDSMINNDSSELRNSTINHAKLLIYLLIHKAKEDIVIFSGDLDTDCYDDEYIKDVLRSAVESGINIKAITVNGKKIAKIFSDLEIEVKNIDLSKCTNKLLLENHFMVCDKNAYRWESKHDAKIDFVKARVNFNNPKIALPLISIFEELTVST